MTKQKALEFFLAPEAIIHCEFPHLVAAVPALLIRLKALIYGGKYVVRYEMLCEWKLWRVLCETMHYFATKRTSIWLVGNCLQKPYPLKLDIYLFQVNYAQTYWRMNHQITNSAYTHKHAHTHMHSHLHGFGVKGSLSKRCGWANRLFLSRAFRRWINICHRSQKTIICCILNTNKIHIVLNTAA